MPVVHTFDPPERFVAGTVGEPGQRTFFLQARDGSKVVSVSLEKQQVQILGERIEEMLDELLTTAGLDTVIPAVMPLELADAEPLEQPITEEFRAGTITLSWDNVAHRVVVEIFPFQEAEITLEAGEDELPDLPIDEPEPEELLIVRMPPAMARAFCSRAASVVSAGRASCPFCGGPIDPEGHLCPRANGFRRTQA